MADRSAELGIRETDVVAPAASPGRAVVEVHAVSLNRGELLHVQRYHLVSEGAVPGWDVAGVVVEPATDGAGPPAGTRVFGWSDARGTWAERVAVRVDHLAVAPAGLSMEDASTLGVAALTAYAALGRASRPLPGSRVLVTGATGGVGTFAVQLALLGGATTTAVVREGADAGELGDLLPDGVTVERGLAPDGEPSDLIVESVGGDSLSAALRRVAPGGTVVTLGRTTDVPATLPPGWFQKHAQLHGLSFSRDFGGTRSFTAALDRLAALVAAGSLRTNVTEVADRRGLLDLMAGILDRRVRGKAVVRWTAG